MSDVIRLPVLQPAPPTREMLRSRRKREVRKTTESMIRLSRRVLSLDGSIADAIFEELGPIKRPRTRGECKDGPRPCPWVSCRHHLFLDVQQNGSVTLNFPDVARGVASWEGLPATCALDVADEGGSTLERVAEMANVTRERIRQIEERAVARVEKKAERLLGDFRGHRVELGEATVDSVDSDGGGGGTTQGETVDDADGVARHVWQLFEGDDPARPIPETPARLHVAQIRAFTAYEQRLTERGLITAKRHPLADERLAEVERTIAARAAETETETMPKKPTDEELDERREMILARLRDGGPANAPAVAKSIGGKPNTIGRAMRELVEEGAIVTNGRGGRGCLYGIPSTEFVGAQRPKAGRVAARVVDARPITLADVERKPGAARFIVRVEGVEVDCADASAVLELARAARAL